MSYAKGHIGTQAYVTRITTGTHSLTADEPPANGGKDAGPAPYDLLTASLTACTTITLRMYADRKGWEISAIEVGVHFGRDDSGLETIERTLAFTGRLDKTQKARLLEIAEKTPVTRTLKRALTITTKLA